jgi:beta-galactosidase
MKSFSRQIISGALHYFRVHPGLWDDRLEKAVAMGLNTIETYVPWNLHEPHRGEYVFDGICDIETFIRKAQNHQLQVIVRPGPYICAEWDNGGFPGWLLALPGVKLRCADPVYLEAVEQYFTVLFDRLRPLLCTNGGPVIMLQIENEYGSFGNDQNYLKHLVSLYRKLQMDVPYFTSDGPASLLLSGGATEGITPTVNFGMNNEKAFAVLKKFAPDAPECCMEFWDGWFDHWGQKHQLRPAEDGGEAFASEYEKIIARGAHINLYMFHGGTNFGFTAGANGNNYTDYSPIVTSYDYDCPLSEAGDPTEKYLACQRILKKYTGNPRIRPVEKSEKIAPGDCLLEQSALLRDNIKNIAAQSGRAVVPPTLEELGENFGFIHYAVKLPPYEGEPALKLHDVNDYVQIWLDGKYLGSRFRRDEEKKFIIPGKPQGSVLELLVESTGRINYGPFVGKDRKGIAGSVCLGMQTIFNWEYDLLPMSDISNIAFAPAEKIETEPAFYRGTFEVEKTADTFLKRPGTKGVVWINGFNLGRYSSAGPTETLYVPAPVLKKGVNEIVIFEQEKLLSLSVSFSKEHDLGEMELYTRKV